MQVEGVLIRFLVVLIHKFFIYFFISLTRDTYTIADELVNVVYVAIIMLGVLISFRGVLIVTPPPEWRLPSVCR